MQNSLFRIATISSLVIFISYWGTTFFFNLPDNYLKIKSSPLDHHFQEVFFQKWTFFAPPPKHNDRLYYIFKNNSDSTKIKAYEAVEILTKQKKDKAPFNEKEQLFDYIISNTTHSVNDLLRAYQDKLQYEDPDADEMDIVKKSEAVMWERRDQFYHVKTLEKYGRVIAKQQNLDPEEHSVKFVLCRATIPKFSERNDKDFIPKEQIIFESPFYQL